MDRRRISIFCWTSQSSTAATSLSDGAWRSIQVSTDMYFRNVSGFPGSYMSSIALSSPATSRVGNPISARKRSSSGAAPKSK